MVGLISSPFFFFFAKKFRIFFFYIAYLFLFRMKYFSLIFLLLVLYTINGEGKRVKDVAREIQTEEEFDSLLKSKQNGLLMVNFFSPYASNYSIFSTEYEKAAKMLHRKVTFATVDCSILRSLCLGFKIQKYPFVLYFKKGKEPIQYDGGISSADLIDFIEVGHGPKVHLVSSKEELHELKSVNRPIAVFLSNSLISDADSTFGAWSEKYRNKVIFAASHVKSIFPGVPEGKMTILRENEIETYSGDGSEASLDRFFKLAALPFVLEYSARTRDLFLSIFANGVPPHTGFLVTSGSVDKELAAAIAALAVKRRNEIVFVLCDVTACPFPIAHAGLSKDSELPAFTIDKDKNFYLPQLDFVLTENSISHFIDQTLGGEILPFLRSDPIPEVDTVDGLTTLVSKTLTQYLRTTEMLILFYSPKCRYCKKFLPIYRDFAKEMESKFFMVAQIDATTNDVFFKTFEVIVYPTLYFVHLDGTLKLYSGDFTYKSLKSFVYQELNWNDDTFEPSSDL